MKPRVHTLTQTYVQTNREREQKEKEVVPSSGQRELAAAVVERSKHRI